MSNIVQISRNPFWRNSVIRKVDKEYTGCRCRFCNGERKTGNLFRYGTKSDGGTINWDRTLFCCKACRDSYHS